MAEKTTRHDTIERDETPRQADVALLVAALGGGPDSGDRVPASSGVGEAEREPARVEDIVC
jgi:hypothetical protein